MIYLYLLLAFAIPKKADVIIAKNMTYQEAGLWLVENDYSIKSSNEEFGIITTDWKEDHNWGGYTAYKLKVVIKEGDAHITGDWKMHSKVDKSTYDYKMEYTRGGSKSFFKDVVKSLEGYELDYYKSK